jgi:hypothetical protein
MKGERSMRRNLIIAVCIAAGTAIAFIGPHFDAVGAYSDPSASPSASASASPSTSPSGSPSASPSTRPSTSPSGSPGDLVPPNTEITAGPTGSTKKTRPTFEFTSSEQQSTFQCSLDEAAFSSCSSPFQTERLKHGSHTFSVRAVDASGNVDPTPASQDFKVKKKKKNPKPSPSSRPRPDGR